MQAQLKHVNINLFQSQTLQIIRLCQGINQAARNATRQGNCSFSVLKTPKCWAGHWLSPTHGERVVALLGSSHRKAQQIPLLDRGLIDQIL